MPVLFLSPEQTILLDRNLRMHGRGTAVAKPKLLPKPSFWIFFRARPEAEPDPFHDQAHEPAYMYVRV